MSRIIRDADVTWRGKPVPDALVRFSRMFHQDASDIHGTPDAIVVSAIASLTGGERAELAAYLRKLLSGKYDDSDLKGLWNRLPASINISRGVRDVLETALNQLGDEA